MTKHTYIVTDNVYSRLLKDGRKGEIHWLLDDQLIPCGWAVKIDGKRITDQVFYYFSVAEALLDKYVGFKSQAHAVGP
jgi:hypothetical protein